MNPLCALSRSGFAGLLNPLGGRTTYFVGLGALSPSKTE